MKHDDIVTAMPQHSQGIDHWFRVAQQIRKQHEQASVSNHRRDTAQIACHIRLSSRPCLGQQAQHVAQLASLASCGKAGVQFF